MGKKFPRSLVPIANDVVSAWTCHAFRKGEVKNKTKTTKNNQTKKLNLKMVLA